MHLWSLHYITRKKGLTSYSFSQKFLVDSLPLYFSQYYIYSSNYFITNKQVIEDYKNGNLPTIYKPNSDERYKYIILYFIVHHHL